MTCQEFKTLAPAWALGTLDAEEARACEEHLASSRVHEGCESALARAEQAARLLSLELPPARPPERVWDGIEESLAREAHSEMRRASALPAWSRFSGALALAASVAVICLLLGHRAGREEAKKEEAALTDLQARTASDLALAQTARTHLSEQMEACRRDLQATQDSLSERQRALSLLADPSSQVVDLAPQASFNSAGSVILNRSKHKAVLFAKSLSPVANRDYEIWVIRAGSKVPAGLLKVEPSGSGLALIDDQLLQAGVDLFAITLEPAGGGPTPRGPLVMVGEVKKG